MFGLFWIAELLSAIFQYIIIVGVCTWYFSSSYSKRGNLALSKGLWWAFRYNFGSLAFGSFLLAIIWTIRLIFEYVNKKIKDLNGDNAAVKCISKVIRCCLDCCHRFVKFINENAYIQVALTGENFCTSAMAGFVLALKHSGSFIITNGIGSMIGFIGKVTIATGNTFIGYLLLTQTKLIADQIDSPIPPLAVIFVMSYLVATVFMSVYSIISLTILQCLYADVDICNQNKEDVYDGRFRPQEMDSIVNMLKK